MKNNYRASGTRGYEFHSIKIFLPACIALLFFSTGVNAQSLEVVKEINTTGFSSSYPFDLTVADNKLFFLASDNSGTSGLWVTAGTTATTQKLSPSTGPLNSVGDIIAYNNKIYFAYNDGVNGNELWVSDGTVAGTAIFKDLYPGSIGSFPSAFTVANNKLFFMGSSVDGERRLYVSDGTPGGTMVIKNNYIGLFNGMLDFAVMNTEIYFNSDNGTGSGNGLWKSDGTAGGTILVKADVISGTFGGNYAVLNNKLYYSGFDYTNGGELWVTDGTDPGTHMVINLSTDVGGTLYSGQPQSLVVYNNKIYFSGQDDTHGSELFVTDGTAGGTQLVKDIVAGTDGSVPNKGVLMNGLLYFTCALVGELWKTDGTPAGTELVKTGLNNATIAAVWNGKLYIVLGNGDNNAVWQSDGTTAGTTPIQLQNTANPVSSLSSDIRFKEYNSALYLNASNNDITVGYELAKITGGVLPLHLLSFTGQADNNNDLLKWTTADEVNTAQFVVQQSVAGSVFSSVGIVSAAGNKAGKTDYRYTQPATISSGSFYRLQMVDKDGKFTYSPVIKIKRTAGNNSRIVYNTINKQIVIHNNTQGVCNWQLLSMNGSALQQGTSVDAVININATGIAAGTYIISCKMVNETITTRLVIY